MMKKGRFLLEVLLVIACMSLMCCGKKAPTQSVYVELSDSEALDDYIMEKAETLAEEGTFEEGDIYVDSILYGNYSQSEETELLALCKFKNNVHVAGMDRTLAIIFSQESMEVITYKNFGYDEVVLHPLPTEDESKILFIGRTTYQDITSQYIRLYTIAENEWIESPFEGVEIQEDEWCYITDDNRLIVGEKTVYAWDEHEAQFVLVASKAEELGEKYGQEIMERFMKVDLSAVDKEIPSVGNIWESVKRLAAIPTYDITMYGYNDEEYSGRGVAIQIGEDVNYFDWDYLSPRGIMPQMYWNDTKNQLQVALNLYTGTGVGAQELHILQQHETGTLSDYVWRLEDYSSLLEERLSYIYDSTQQILEIYDKNNNDLLGKVDVSWLEESKVENIVAGEISNFWLGEELWLEFTPGYLVEGWGAPQYEGMPTLEVQINLKSLEDGEFELGEMRLLDIRDNVLEEDINQILSGSMPALDEDNFQEMTRDEILDYYQIEMDIPSLLPNVTEKSDTQYGFYYFEDGSVFDQQSFFYQGDAGQTLNIKVRKDKLPIHSLGESYSQELKKAYIANHEVLIILFKASGGKYVHYAEFLADGLGISITAEEFTYDDFILVVKYLSEVSNKTANSDNEIWGNAQYLKDIDWENFGTRISDYEYQALQKYLSVLEGEEFVWIYRSGAGKEPDTYTHDRRQITINNMVGVQFEENGYEAEEPVVDSIWFADVFQTGNKDMALLLRYLGWHWLILHEEDGIIYGIDMPVRWLYEVQEDGLYYNSGGAEVLYYHRMKFEDGDYIEEDVAEVHYGEFFVNGEKKSDEEYQAWKKENVKEEVKWYKPLEE